MTHMVRHETTLSHELNVLEFGYISYDRGLSNSSSLHKSHFSIVHNGLEGLQSYRISQSLTFQVALGREYKEPYCLREMTIFQSINLVISLLATRSNLGLLLLSSDLKYNLIFQSFIIKPVPNIAQSNITELKDKKRCINKEDIYNNNISVLIYESYKAVIK